MARIRTIKTEFWTSEQIVECSPNARLLFIGFWNFCDDAGIHPASTKRLKIEIFPGDNFTTEEISSWVTELKTHDLLYEYSVNGKKYWQVTGWNHQKIDRPTYRHPKPTEKEKIADHSTSPRRAVDEPSPPEGGLRESKGKESNNIPEKISEEISPDDQLVSFRSRYSENHQNLIDDVLQAIASTRKHGKVAESVLLTQFKKWERYPVEQVVAGIKTYLDKDCAGEGKGENYLLGVIRNNKPVETQSDESWLAGAI